MSIVHVASYASRSTHAEEHANKLYMRWKEKIAGAQNYRAICMRKKNWRTALFSDKIKILLLATLARAAEEKKMYNRM